MLTVLKKNQLDTNFSLVNPNALGLNKKTAESKYITDVTNVLHKKTITFFILITNQYLYCHTLSSSKLDRLMNLTAYVQLTVLQSVGSQL